MVDVTSGITDTTVCVDVTETIDVAADIVVVCVGIERNDEQNGVALLSFSRSMMRSTLEHSLGVSVRASSSRASCGIENTPAMERRAPSKVKASILIFGGELVCSF